METGRPAALLRNAGSRLSAMLRASDGGGGAADVKHRGDNDSGSTSPTAPPGDNEKHKSHSLEPHPGPARGVSVSDSGSGDRKTQPSDLPVVIIDAGDENNSPRSAPATAPGKAKPQNLPDPNDPNDPASLLQLRR